MFPMFYYKTLWTISGQKNVLLPNLCTSSELSGVSRDVVTGGECREDVSTGLPDHNCYFTAFQNNTVYRWNLQALFRLRTFGPMRVHIYDGAGARLHFPVRWCQHQVTLLAPFGLSVSRLYCNIVRCLKKTMFFQFLHVDSLPRLSD